jgi:hypothetical protein
MRQGHPLLTGHELEGVSSSKEKIQRESNAHGPNAGVPSIYDIDTYQNQSTRTNDALRKTSP